MRFYHHVFEALCNYCGYQGKRYEHNCPLQQDTKPPPGFTYGARVVPGYVSPEFREKLRFLRGE
jgi:hypothetical protein